MLRTLLICLVLVVGTYGAFRSRFGAMLFYLWFAFFRPQEFTYFDLSALHLSLVVGLLFVVPSLLGGTWPNVSHPLSIGMMLFLIVALCSQTQAERPDIGWLWIDYMARLILVTLLAISIIRTRRELLLTVATVAGSLGFHAAKAGLASLLAGGLQYADGLAGPWIDNNGYALAGAMIVFPLIAVGQNVQTRLLRFGWFAAAALTVVTIISTFSREGFLALIVATVTFILLQRRRLVMMTALGAALLVGAAVVPIPEGYGDRMQTIRTYREVGDESALSRLHFWQVGGQMALDRPLGVGLRNFEAAYDRYDSLGGVYGTERSVHSSHVQVLAELGIPGAIVWLGLLSYSLYLGLKVRARAGRQGLSIGERYFDFTIANALLASMSAFIVGGSFIALALNDFTWLTFALLASLDRLPHAELEPGSVARPVSASTLAPGPARNARQPVPLYPA